MSRTNDDVRAKAERDFFRLVVRNNDSQRRLRQTPEAKKFIQVRNALSERIIEAIDNAVSIEDLIHYEMALQHLDERLAQSPQDKTSIENAQRGYRQLSETVAQMRRNPDEYIRANISFPDTNEDFRKMPRGRIQHIHSNVTRLRNRASFALAEDFNLWDARLKLAKKTEDMLRALHKSKVEEYERNMGD